MEKVTIGIVNYNGKATLPQTIESIQRLKYSDFTVVVADNFSTDGSREWLTENYPDVQRLCLAENRGPAGGRNAILQASTSNYILFLDNDITLEADTLIYLMNVMQTVPNVAVCHPEICDPTDPMVYHYNGGWIHYLGAYISRNNDKGERPEYEIFDVVSGAAMLVDRKAALMIGGFDEDYFFNWEDGDFVIRFTLTGYHCVNVPQAIVYHLGKPRGASKAFYMVRNRWYFMLKIYSWRTLILSFPVLLLFEIAQALLLIVQGHWQDYWKANYEVLQHIPDILQKRQQFQALKIKRDRDWLKAGELYVSTSIVASKSSFSRLKEVISRCLNLYWQLVRLAC
ncbi:MAG: glycosyltransferase [Microcoleaceae cyanobacterium]